MSEFIKSTYENDKAIQEFINKENTGKNNNCNIY